MRSANCDASTWVFERIPTTEGEHALSVVVEEAWLPVIGPTSLALFRLISRELERSSLKGSARWKAAPHEIAFRLGFRGAKARPSLQKSMERLERSRLIVSRNFGTVFGVKENVHLPYSQDRQREEMRRAWLRKA